MKSTSARKESPWQVEYDKCIAQGEFTVARSLLKTVKPESEAQARQIAHFLGKSYLHEGEFEVAYQELQSAISAHGSNVQILCELALAQYLLARMPGFHRTVKSIEGELEGCLKKISFETQISAFTNLAKFQEELGQTSKAISLYQNLMEQREIEMSPAQLMRVRSNLLRLRSGLREKNGLGVLYNQLAAERKRDLGGFRIAEAEHGLLLAEFTLFGKDSALSRLREILARAEIPTGILRLMIFDTLELLLLDREEIPADLRDAALRFGPQDPYERELLKCMTQDQIEVNMEALALLPQEMSLACYLRLVSIYLAHEKNASRRLELWNRMVLALDGLDEGSKKYWESRISTVTAAPENIKTFRLRPADQSCVMDGKVISFRSRTTMWALLNALSKRSDLTTEELVKQVWDAPLNESYQSRAKVLVHRLNQLLKREFGVSRSIRFNKTGVTLSESFRISMDD